MANTLNNTLNKVGSVADALFGGKKKSTITKGQTHLEKIGMEAREENLSRNRWDKEGQYTKSLVDSEYLIQTEFEIS